jgi:uncharacterized protein (DUF1697 family)
VSLSTYVALLRGINVGGHKPVAMAALRDLLAELGFSEVQSVLQSGNLVFRSRPREGATLERLLEGEARKRLALETDVMVRTSQEWAGVLAGNPFRREAQRDPGHLVAMFLKAAPAGDRVEALRAAITGPEVMRVSGREAFIVYPDGIGRSRLTNALIEKTLGTRGTARNWNTVLKIGALAGS